MSRSAATEGVSRRSTSSDAVSLGAILAGAARRYRGREMLSFRGVSRTYEEFDRWVNQIANALLREGVRHGDPIASIARNSDRLLALYFAVAKVGAVNVPLNAMSTARDVADLVRRSEARMIFYEGELADRVAGVDAPTLRERVVLDPEAAPAACSDRSLEDLERGASEDEPDATVSLADPATVIYTSGSTGLPKGCLKSHSNLIWSAVNCQLETPRSLTSVELFAIPLSGIGLANFLLPTLMAGGRVVLDCFAPGRVLDLIEREGATNAFLAGTMLDALLAEDPEGEADLGSFRLLETAYQLSDRLREGIAERFSTVRYCYGSTEGTNWAAPAECFLSKPDCVGLPKGLDRYRLVGEDGSPAQVGETGEVLVSGPTVMLGYFRDDEATERVLGEGELRTGDLGEMDEDGMMRFRGRLKDVIKTGGMNVAAGDVEMAIARHPAVTEVAVLGIADDHWGEAIHAVVALDPDAIGAAEEADLVASLKEHCQAELAGFKRPKGYSLIDSLPKNPGGKIAKGSVRELVLERTSQESAQRD